MPHVLGNPIEDNPLSIDKVTKNGVILEVNMDTPEAAAEWPYLSAGWMYLTYTLGKDHRLTAIGRDASRTPLGVSGRSGTSLGLDQDLWDHVIQTARDGGVLTDMPFGSIVTSAHVFMRDGGTAQITLKGRSLGGAITEDFTVLPGGSIDEAIEVLERRFPQHGKITTEPNHYVGTVWKCAIPDAPSVPKELLSPAKEKPSHEEVASKGKDYSHDDANSLISCYSACFVTSYGERDLMSHLAGRGGEARRALVDYIAGEFKDAVDRDDTELASCMNEIESTLSDDDSVAFETFLRNELGIDVDALTVSEERA